MLSENGLDHQRIKPHCPEENGVIERSNRTIREGLEGEELKDLVQAQGVMARIIKRYNEERLHSALGYLRPVDYYRGDPQAKKEARRLKMAQARHRRRERNLNLEQPTLPYTAEDPVANP
ncbi:MAG TPA: integrase core domain-containing protein [Verrucomicrobiota bacterium]|nr:integrase core domain-containing protein [Verrucomicrobiota bacterium]